MGYYIDISHKSINKFGEELCGDKVETLKTEDGYLMVLSDGLGSGVKANILATLTSKIAITMLGEGASIEETIEIIMDTLPECKVRKLAYSTFTIIKISNSGECYVVEYENPPIFFYKNGRTFPIERVRKEVKGKVIFESNFLMATDDLLVVVSDGAVHAGVGEYLNLGWQWENINDFLKDISKKRDATDITNSLLDVCKTLYNEKPGDDTTVLAVKIQPIKYLTLFVGPPRNKDKDEEYIKKVENTVGKVVLSGGTTANIVAKSWKKNIEIDLNKGDYSIPPVGHLKGVDLVTEGQITLTKTLEYLTEYRESKKEITEEDGAGVLGRMLLFDASHIHIVAGTAVNMANQNLDFSMGANIKLKIINELINILKTLGKTVTIEYL